MSDFDTAVQRLTAWVRDYGDSKPREFIGDVSMLLVAARENYRLHAEIERLQAALADARCRGETMPCGHNSHWLVYGNPVDVNSERHCLFCEVERLRKALEGQIELWGFVDKDLRQLAATRCIVPFMDLHDPIGECKRALGETK